MFAITNYAIVDIAIWAGAISVIWAMVASLEG
jgi:hypothetical protein